VDTLVWKIWIKFKQGGTVSYAVQNAGCLQQREKEKGGENINKTISAHYKAVQLSIFI